MAPDCGQVVMVAMTSVIRKIFFLADNYSLAHFISSYRKAIMACVKRKINASRRNWPIHSLKGGGSASNIYIYNTFLKI